MDLLYRAYSSPLDLVNRYINQGRFGEFVGGFIQAEYKRKVEEAEKYDDLKLWLAYVHSYSKESFDDFKKRVVKTGNDTGSPGGGDETLDNDGIMAIIDQLFPDNSPQRG